MATVEIPLTQGKVAVIDAEDLSLIQGYSWHACFHGHTWYAKAWEPGASPKRKVYMHRLIVGAREGTEVDHRDRNGLNNCRDNLRIVSRQQNCRNQKLKHGASAFKGVSFCRRDKRWVAQIRDAEGRKRNLGRYDTEQEAASAYDAAALRFHGSFAYANGEQ